jgi:putative lipoprotein
MFVMQTLLPRAWTRLNSALRYGSALSIGLLAADLCAQASAGPVTVNGTATYLQRIAMPPDAVLTVRLQDVSRADAPATLLAETSESFGARQVPIPFSLQVPAAAIDPRMSYAVRATITVGGELRFTTTRHHAVLTRGAPSQVALVLEPVRSAAPPAAAGAAQATATLKDTYWKLVELDGTTLALLPRPEREVRVTLASQGTRVIGFSGCNPLVASYEQDGPALRFKPASNGPLTCAPPLMELEARVLSVLGVTTGYRIDGERLTLLAGDRVLARLEAVYLR